MIPLNTEYDHYARSTNLEFFSLFGILSITTKATLRLRHKFYSSLFYNRSTQKNINGTAVQHIIILVRLVGISRGGFEWKINENE